MAIVIHDATIVTVDDADTVLHGGAVAVEGSRIAAIGPSAQVLAAYPGAERIDGSGRAVLPGFANTHTHLVLTIARGIYEDLRRYWMVTFDSGSNIGKLYRRQDEIGTPYCVTVDFQSLDDKQVTVRDRDSMQQERVPIADLRFWFEDKLNFY